MAFIVPALTTIISVIHLFNNPTSQAIVEILFLFLILTGVIITTLLLWFEIDEYNPVLKQVCQATEKVNCSAVLHSNAAKIFGLSWSSLGFVYFTGMLLSLLVTGISQEALVLSAWISLPTLCYLFFSIYYQWKVVRQWCLLCLGVQGILLLIFITAISGGFYYLPISQSLSLIAGYFVTFLLVFIAITILIPALQNAKSNNQKTIELQRMKHNPLIFEGVLVKQRSIPPPSFDLGIQIGNANSVFKLIKVCNPYCGPCAKAHPIMEDLLANNEDVSLQIIFTASNDENDMKRKPVMHLLAIASKANQSITEKALADWYEADQKDYNVFAAKYPMNGELNMQAEKVKKMKEWCNETRIAFTPTFFISVNNNTDNAMFFQLPEMYTVADLKYFFTV